MGEQQAQRLMPSSLVPRILKIDLAQHEDDKIHLITEFIWRYDKTGGLILRERRAYKYFCFANTNLQGRTYTTDSQVVFQVYSETINEIRMATRSFIMLQPFSCFTHSLRSNSVNIQSNQNLQRRKHNQMYLRRLVWSGALIKPSNSVWFCLFAKFISLQIALATSLPGLRD